jgi:hypothetical protein
MVIGEDAYGTNCPGMEALGNAKAITRTRRISPGRWSCSAGRRRRAARHEHACSCSRGKITNLPPNAPNAAGPTALRTRRICRSGIEATSESIREMASQINRTLYADLWQMLTLGTDRATPGRR